MQSSARNRHIIRFRKPSNFKKPEYLDCISPAITTPKNAAKQMMISIYSKTIKRTSNSERKMNVKVFRKINNTITYDDEPLKCPIHSKLINNNYMIKASKQMQQIRRGSIQNKSNQNSRECNIKINSTLKKEIEYQVKPYENKVLSSNHSLHNHNILLFNSRRKINEPPNHSKKHFILPSKPSIHKIITQSSTPIHQVPSSKTAFKNQHRILKNLLNKNNPKKSLIQPKHKNLLNNTAPLQSDIKIAKASNQINKAQTISQEDEKCLKEEIAKLFQPKKPAAIQTEARDTPTRLSDSESIVLYDGCQVKPAFRDEGIEDCSSSSIQTDEREDDSHPIESSTPLLINYKCPAPLSEVNKNENDLSLNKLHLLNLVSSNELDDMKSKIHLNLRKEIVAKSVRKNKNSFDRAPSGILNNPLRRRMDEAELNMNV